MERHELPISDIMEKIAITEQKQIASYITTISNRFPTRYQGIRDQRALIVCLVAVNPNIQLQPLMNRDSRLSAGLKAFNI